MNFHKLTNDVNRNTTHGSNCLMENMSQLFYIGKLFEGKLSITFNIIHYYQWKEPRLPSKHNVSAYKQGSFCGLRHTVF